MLEYLIQDDMVSKEDRIAVGVSGGADSMLLLWSLIDKQKQVGFYLKVINVNHHIRGKESDDDSLFVESFCKKRKIDYEIVDVDVKTLKNDEKLTLEESARIARYNAFNKVMKDNKLNKLFLAHHKNDQAETILMHIFRGSGISGAVGIKNSSTIIRPLLNLKKSEILNLVKEHGIEFVEDSTNFENDCSRNFLRNVILPQIENVYGGVVDNICAFGEKCADIQKYILSQVDENLIKQEKDSVVLLDEIFSQNMIVAREYIKIAFEKIGVFADIETKHFELVYNLANFEVNKQIDLPHESFAQRTYDGVRICKKKNKQKCDLVLYFEKNGEIKFNEQYSIKSQVVKKDDVVYGDGSLYVDASKISTNAVWRCRQLGDVFSKFGTGSKKLNDCFTNLKIDIAKRDNLPILAVENQVLVLPGFEVSEYVKIDGETDEIVKITLLEN